MTFADSPTDNKSEGKTVESRAKNAVFERGLMVRWTNGS